MVGAHAWIRDLLQFNIKLLHQERGQLERLVCEILRTSCPFDVVAKKIRIFIDERVST